MIGPKSQEKGTGPLRNGKPNTTMTTTMTMKKRVVLAAWLLAALAVPVYATESSSDDAPLPGQELAPKTPPGEDDAEFYAGSAEVRPPST